MRHIILFGGSFDPIHTGHLQIAKAALKETKADELWFLLAAINPFKEAGTAFEDRQKMIELMIQPFKKMKLSRVEKDLPIPSYSYDTVKHLLSINKDVKFSWLIGSDQIEHLDKWYKFEKLNALVEFIVYDRSGYHHDHTYKTIKGSSVDVSSTDIRNGQSTNTKKSILRYMMLKGLYLNPLTENKMSDKRYQHTLRVTDLAIQLAKQHNLDEDKMRLIAMTHDWCKEWPKEELKNLMASLYPQHLDLPPAFYHGFCGSAVLSKHYNIKDKEILSAIRSHVNGQSTNPYAMALYIADKCEPERKYNTKPYVDMALRDLRKGFKAVKALNEKYLKETL